MSAKSANSERPTRWGICSAGRISHDFVLCLRHANKQAQGDGEAVTKHEVVAVAARESADAEKFAAEHGIAKSYGGYEKLAHDDEVDVVYVSMLHTHHFPAVRTLLEAGKAVLCEKPMTMCAKHTRELVRIAKEKKVFLMEAICSPFLPLYNEVLDGLEEIGPVQHAIIPFGWSQLKDSPRVVQYELGGSLILDCVLYSFSRALHIFKEKPIELKALGTLNSEGVDVNSTIIMKFKGGALCTLINSATADINLETKIVGTKGSIKITSGIADSVCINGRTLESSPAPDVDGKPYYHSWLGGEIDHVRECLLQGRLESPSVSWNHSITLAELMDEALHQLGARVRVIEDEASSR